MAAYMHQLNAEPADLRILSEEKQDGVYVSHQVKYRDYE